MLDKWYKKEKPVFTGIARGIGGLGFGGAAGSGPTQGTASGGVVAAGVADPDGYTYHYFKNPGGTLTVSGASIVCEMLVVAGGGAGGARVGGGGGAGGIAVAGVAAPMTIPVGSHTVTVGAGGNKSGTSNPTYGSRGGDSSFGSSPNPFYVLAKGGGGGGGEGGGGDNVTPGGSGGGAEYNYHIGTATQPTQNPGKPWVTNYGTNGGGGTSSPTHNSGGGGGAGGAGTAGTASPDARGQAGSGQDFPQFSVPKYMPAPDPYRPGINPLPGTAYGGGGGAGDYPPNPGSGPSILPQNMPSSATNGGGGVGGPQGAAGNGTPAVNGLGGGGGGGTGESPGPLAGDGGDGIIVIRYQP